jgi:hypothetical protein
MIEFLSGAGLLPRRRASVPRPAGVEYVVELLKRPLSGLFQKLGNVFRKSGTPGESPAAARNGRPHKSATLVTEFETVY